MSLPVDPAVNIRILSHASGEHLVCDKDFGLASVTKLSDAGVLLIRADHGVTRVLSSNFATRRISCFEYV